MSELENNIKEKKLILDEELDDLVSNTNDEVSQADIEFGDDLYKLISNLIKEELNEKFVSQDNLKTHFDKHCIANDSSKVSTKYNVYYNFTTEEQFSEYENKINDSVTNTNYRVKSLYDAQTIIDYFKEVFKGNNSIYFTNSCDFSNDVGPIGVGVYAYSSDVTTNYKNKNTVTICILSTKVNTITIYPVDLDLLENKLNAIIKKYNKNQVKIKITDSLDEDLEMTYENPFIKTEEDKAIYDYFIDTVIGRENEDLFHKLENGEIPYDLDENLQEKIVKKGSKWQVQSEKGRNLGTFDTKEEAEKRLKQIEYFKHIDEAYEPTEEDFPFTLDDVINYVEKHFPSIISNTYEPCGPAFILPDGRFLLTGKEFNIHSDFVILIMESLTSNFDFSDWDYNPLGILEAFTKYFKLVRVNDGTTPSEDRAYFVIMSRVNPTGSQWDSLSDFIDDVHITYKKSLSKDISAFVRGAYNKWYLSSATTDDIIDDCKTALRTGHFLEDLKELEDKLVLTEGSIPTKTGKAYKLFKMINGKLYPPMVANPNNEDTPIGIWVDAKEGEFAGLSKTGRQQVKSKGSGTLAYRPGWHLGDLPYAPQFESKSHPGYMNDPNFVWAECDYAMDIDYQKEADEQGYIRTKINDKGEVETSRSDKYQHSLAGLKKLPNLGYYKYRTNPRPDTIPWVITGQMKVNKILSDEEVEKICKENNVPYLKVPRNGELKEELEDKVLNIDDYKLKDFKDLFKSKVFDYKFKDKYYYKDKLDFKYNDAINILTKFGVSYEDADSLVFDLFGKFSNQLDIVGALYIYLKNNKEKKNESINESMKGKTNITDEKILKYIDECIEDMKKITFTSDDTCLTYDDIDIMEGDTTQTFGTMSLPKDYDGNFVLTLNKHMYNEDEKAVKNTILHELCHYVVYKIAIDKGILYLRDDNRWFFDVKYPYWKQYKGHNVIWKSIADKVSRATNQEITRTNTYELHNEVGKHREENIKYIVRCKNCDCTLKYQKMTDFVRNPNAKSKYGDWYKWKCGKCGSQGKWEVEEL